MTVVGINIVGWRNLDNPHWFFLLIETLAIMMFLRINALYHGNYWVLSMILILLASQCGMNAFLMTRAQRVHHNPDSTIVGACTIHGPVYSSIWSFPSLHNDLRSWNVGAFHCGALARLRRKYLE